MGDEGRRWRGERHIPSSEQLITKNSDHLTWQRAPPATQLTREENSVRGRRIGHQRQGIERGGGGIARRREETRARETGGAWGKNCGVCLRASCFLVSILTLTDQIASPIGHI